MIDLVRSSDDELKPAAFVDACLNAMGTLDLSTPSKSVLVDHAAAAGPVGAGSDDFEDRTVEMLQLIVATPDYQYC